MRLLLTLGLVTLLSAASLHAAGAVKGKHRANLVGKSSSSSDSEVAFAGAYNATGQSIAVSPNTTAISFPTNQPGSPKNVTHPFMGDPTKFAVNLDGTYLIGWTFTLNAINGGGAISVHLLNASTGNRIGPDPFQLYILSGSDEDRLIVSGQTIIHLAQGTVLQLLASAGSSSGNVVQNPTFFVMRVGN